MIKNKSFKVCFIIFALSVLILLFCILFDSFAEAYSVTVSSFLRYSLSLLTGFFGFSLAEIIVLLLPPLVVLLILVLIVCLIKNRKMLSHVLRFMLCTVLVIVSAFIHIFGVCYFRKPIEHNMNLDRKKLTRNEMYQSMSFIKDSLENSLSDIVFKSDGSSVNPRSFLQTDRLIDEGYKKLIKEYPFISDITAKAKQVLMSEPMTYTHISGIYFPFTGEANVNNNYPDYVVVYSTAHEKAHQRGIAGEDDANFVAFLALMYSDDDYLRYSALMSMYDYYLDSIYKVDREMYEYFLKSSHESVYGEMYAYSVFFDKYRDSSASKVADAVNDSYIKVMGDSEGVNSYGNVVELVSAYLDKNNGLPN